MKRYALLSVFKKEGSRELAAALQEMGWEIISTGGTARYLEAEGIKVLDVAEITGFPECLDGRVKTLHPAIHAGLLARRDESSHMDTLKKFNLAAIDLVCVNLYPFFEKVQAAGLSREETVEFIDIGGPAMLRSAAKNYRDVLVLTDPADYAEVLAALRAGDAVAGGAVAGGAVAGGAVAGGASEELRRRLAGKVFDLTSAYDAAIAGYLLDMKGSAPLDPYPEYWPVSLKKGQSLRYGENAHQSAALYLSADSRGAFGGMEQLGGKELGYNNIRDLDLAWKAVSAFGLPSLGTSPLGEADLARLGVNPSAKVNGAACCVAVKHNTPCGIALGETLSEAYEKTYACDPVSIFGGIVACSVKVDALTAARLGELFLEIVVAPDFDEEALAILGKKKNLRIIKATTSPLDRKECIAVDGGLLVQDNDRKLLEKWELVTKTSPAEEDISDLIFGLRAVTYVKSNAIVVVRDHAAVGIGGGQTNRIWAAEHALKRAAEAAAARETGKNGQRARVLASDAYFPFADTVEAAAAAGIRAIIQPGGSIRDKESIEACDKHGLAMIFTGIRHFKH